MPIIKDFKQIVNSLKNFLHLNRPNVDTSLGTFTRDVVIDSPANELSILYNELSRASNAQSPDNAGVGDIESLGRNFQIYRKGPVPATGTASFYSFETPADSVTIPRGTQLTTKASANNTAIQYVTTQSAILSALDFNSDTGRYEVIVPICATVKGTSGNVAAGVITAIMNPIAGVSGVYNASGLTNGADFEALPVFRNRLKTAITGNNVGTTSGYYQTVTRIVEVLDAKVASWDTGPEALRRANTNAVDIYIRGVISDQAPIETFMVSQSAPFQYFLKKQPLDMSVIDSISVTGSITGTFVKDTDFTIVQDTSAYGGTIRGADHLLFTTGVLEEQISIIYSYNSLVESLQNYMDSDDLKVLGADLLINAAFARQINTECTIRILAGFSTSTVIASVENNLQTALNAYQIGEEVQQSDIIAVIVNTTGVDDVSIPLDLFEEDVATGDIEQDDDNNLIIPINSYATAGSIVVNTRE